MNSNEIEDRLISFAVMIIQIIHKLPKNKVANHLSNQLIRSGTSPALNYGEARSADSIRDFIHKLQLVLKELRESSVCLKIIQKSNLMKNPQFVIETIDECDELISIFVKSVQTASKKRKN